MDNAVVSEGTREKDPVELYMDNIKSMDDLKGNKRLKDENFEDYKIRRKAEGIITKAYLQGRFVSINGKPVED